MTSNKHDFEELATPSVAAKELGISVATLRKYSLIVEKVTGNSDYYERTKQKARLYRKQDISDLDAFQQLSKKSNLTLQEAARQIYAVSDKKTEDKKRVEKEKSQAIATDLMDTQEVVKLLNTLQQTIANQNQAIDTLQKQLTRVEKQNQELLEKQKELVAPADPQEKLALAAPEEKMWKFHKLVKKNARLKVKMKTKMKIKFTMKLSLKLKRMLKSVLQQMCIVPLKICKYQ